MVRISIGVQEAHGDGLDPFRDERVDRLVERLMVERHQRVAARVHPLRDLQPPCPFDQGHWFLPPKVVGHRNPDAPQFEDVAKPGSGDQGGTSSFALQNRIGRHRGGMDDFADRLRPQSGLATVGLNPVDNRPRIVRRRRGHLALLQRAIRVEEYEVGERTANVHANAHVGWRAHGVPLADSCSRPGAFPRSAAVAASSMRQGSRRMTTR